MTAERDQGVTARREVEALLEEYRGVWTEWLRIVGLLAAETDPERAAEVAREVAAQTPYAMTVRLRMLPLLRLEMRWRELDPGHVHRLETYAASIARIAPARVSDGSGTYAAAESAVAHARPVR